jgi:hypothetical protein
MKGKNDRRGKAVEMIMKSGNSMPEGYAKGKGAPGYKRGGAVKKGTTVNVIVQKDDPQGKQQAAQLGAKAGFAKGVQVGHAAATAGAGAPPIASPPGAGAPPMAPPVGGPPSGAPPMMPPRPGMKRGGRIKPMAGKGDIKSTDMKQEPAVTKTVKGSGMKPKFSGIKGKVK